MEERFLTQVVLSIMATDRGQSGFYLLLHEDEDTKMLTLPTKVITPSDKIGEVVVDLAKQCVAASPDWYSLFPTRTVFSDDGIISVIYATRMTTNIAAFSGYSWYSIVEIPNIRGRIDPEHLILVQEAINNGVYTK